MSNEILGLLALAVLFAAIFIGFPIAFTLGAVSLGAGFIAFGCAHHRHHFCGGYWHCGFFRHPARRHGRTLNDQEWV